MNKIIIGDAYSELSKLPSNSIDCCITSPPYFGLRDYGIKDQIGNEDSFEEYLGSLRMVFEQIKRIMKHHGTLWI